MEDKGSQRIVMNHANEIRNERHEDLRKAKRELDDAVGYLYKVTQEIKGGYEYYLDRALDMDKTITELESRPNGNGHTPRVLYVPMTNTSLVLLDRIVAAFKRVRHSMKLEGICVSVEGDGKGRPKKESVRHILTEDAKRPHGLICRPGHLPGDKSTGYYTLREWEENGGPEKTESAATQTSLPAV